MTVSSSTNRASYSGNGSLTTFAYSFKVFDQDDLTVILRASNGTETVQTIITDYTVTGVGDVGGGNVVFGTAPASGVTVVIIREQPLTQGLDLVPNDPFPAQSLEESLDKLTFVDQRLSESIDRALTFSVGDFVTDPTLPFKEQRVGTVLAFNETTGDPEVGPTIADTQSIANVSADIALLADIEDGTLETNAITNINGIRTDVTTVSGISANVTTVATNNANVTTVADNDADITTVATNISSVNTVATNISDVIAVANDLNEAVSEVETVANDLNEAISEIETVAASIANVDLVGTDITNVNTIAGSISNVNTTAANIADVNTVAGISGNVTTVAGITADIATVVADGADIGTVAGISADVTAVANNSANVSAVANNSTNINTVAGQTTNLQNVTDNLSEIQGAAANASAAATSATAASDSAAAAAAAFDSFDDKYLGSKTGYADSGTGPTTDNDGNALVEGSLFFSSDANEMRVYDGANWIAASSAGSASLILYEFTATSGQTTFSGADDNGATFGYTTGNAQFVLNGVILDPSDYTATNGTSVVLASGAAIGDLLNVYAFKSFTVADTVSASAGGTFAGNVTFNGTFTSQGIDDNATSTAMTLDSSGNVGIGTDSPAHSISLEQSNKIGWVSTVGSDKAAIEFSGVDDSLRFYNNTGSTERMRIDSSGRVGIGTSSPSAGLDVAYGSAGTIAAEFKNASGFGISITPQVGGSGAVTQIGLAAGESLSFAPNNSEAMRITSSGNIGIGTSSPNADLELGGVGEVMRLSGSSTNAYIRNTDGTTNQWYIGSGGNAGLQHYIYQAQPMTFHTSGTERMRIDSSGNLLVGTTDNNPNNNNAGTSADNGIKLGPEGLISVAAYNNPTQVWNRTGTDGTICDIRKDGTTVGSIGTDAASGDFYVQSLITNHAGLGFKVNEVLPRRNGYVDGIDSLGSSSYRWANLYLSGGVYLGGTGSANKLDDYETGAFTPYVASGWTGVTYSTQAGTYTKVGRLVHFQISIAVSVGNRTANSDRFDIGGLPFTKTGQGTSVSVWSDMWNMGGSNNTANGLIGGTEVEFFQSNYATGGETILTGIEMNSSSGNELYISGTYEAS